MKHVGYFTGNSGFYFLSAHQVPPFKHVKKKCDINQQYLKTVDLHFVKYE